MSDTNKLLQKGPLAKVTMNPPVFIGSVIIILGFVAFGTIAPGTAEALFGVLNSGILSSFGWGYILTVAIFLVVVLILGYSRFGTLKLGPDDAEPDFPYLTWVAMLFAAGMGIGLMFFAVGEPMMHFAAPPTAEAGTVAAQREAMQVTFFHWGLHAWGIYAVVGLSLAYFGFRYNLPLSIRSGLYPFLKERIHGPIGHAVDILAIVGTIFGIATSLGLGVMQINSGLNYLVGMPVNTLMQILLIAVITAIATVSVLTGLDKGIRRLSEFNLILAVALMLFVLMAGPTAHLLQALVQNIGLYLDALLLKTFNIYAYEPTPWIEGWTLFYWAWWISWSPFVGMFIARISRGRTVREFVTAVLFVPVGFTFVWLTIFGNSAMFIDTTVAAGALAQAVSADISVALFRFLEFLPLTVVTSIIAVILVSVFFITSSDSGSLVVDTLAAGGRTDTGSPQRVFWCVLEGAVAAVLLLAGGLAALQTAAIASALPFVFVMLFLCWGLFRGMSADLAAMSAPATATPAAPVQGPSWQKRLSLILHTPNRADVDTFLEDVVKPALAVVAEELKAKGKEAHIEHDSKTGSVSLNVPAREVRDFIYGVQPTSRLLPAFTALEAAQENVYFEARTYFSDGSKGYDVMGMTKEQLISDVLTQFERYLALTHSHETALYASAPELA